MFPFLICYCEGLLYGVDIAGNSIEHTRTLREREGERERERERGIKEDFSAKGEVIYVVPRLVPSKPKCSALSLATCVSLH